MAKTEDLFSRISHIGVVVRDLDKAIEYYQSLGIGPFKPWEGSDVRDKTMYGKPIDFQMRVAAAKMGPIEFELIQPVRDSPVMEEFLKSKGEGLHHIAFLTNNFNEEVEKLTKKGLKVILTARFGQTGAGAYIDASEVGGVIFEINQD